MNIKYRALISVFKNSFLFLRTKNTQNVFDKSVFFVPMCSPCFLKPDFERTNKWCFSCFCHCSKKKKKKECSSYFQLVFLGVLISSLWREIFTLWGKMLKKKKKSKNRSNKKSIKNLTLSNNFYFLFFGHFRFNIFPIFQDLSPFNFSDAFQS